MNFACSRASHKWNLNDLYSLRLPFPLNITYLRCILIGRWRLKDVPFPAFGIYFTFTEVADKCQGKDITLCKFLKLETEFCVKSSDGAVRGVVRGVVRGTQHCGRAAAARRTRSWLRFFTVCASLPPAAV